MATMPLSSPIQQPHAEALALSQEAPHHLRKYTASKFPFPIPLLSNAENPELWTNYERLLLSCLRTGDDKSAFMCLEKLIERFGASNERVMGLRGLYQESVAEGGPALEKVLREYDAVLAEDPTNTPIAKRRIALLQTLSKTKQAVEALVELLDASPTDIEAWAELAELYVSQGLFSQANYCLEEILLVAPNAWNIHARLGEVLFMSATSDRESNAGVALAESMRRFCRSIELCDGYLRGYYGLKLTSDQLLSNNLHSAKSASSSLVGINDEENLPIPSIQTLRKLNEQATLHLAQIVRSSGTGQYDDREIAAAKELLDRTTQAMTR